MKSSIKHSNYHFQYSIMINDSQHKIWAFLTDVNRWKEWDTELKESNLYENFKLNAKGILTPKKGPKLKFQITEITPNNSYIFVTKMPVGTLVIKRTLKQVGEQIEFTDDIRFTGFLKGLFGLMLGGGFKSVLPEVMNNFKTIAEQELTNYK